jgi:DnaK suppressor protein
VDPDRARELLARERARVEEAIAALGRKDPDAHEHPEPGDESDEELYQDEFDEGRAEDFRAELAAVERAEARLEAGTYGVSVESGEAIPDERLEALPTAERTVEEQRGRRLGQEGGTV